jgi:hypothetical protein
MAQPMENIEVCIPIVAEFSQPIVACVVVKKLTNDTFFCINLHLVVH